MFSARHCAFAMEREYCIMSYLTLCSILKAICPSHFTLYCLYRETDRTGKVLDLIERETCQLTRAPRGRKARTCTLVVCPKLDPDFAVEIL